MRRTNSRGMVGAIAGALVLSLAACSGGGTDEETPAPDATSDTPVELRIGTFVEPASLDPAQAQEGNYIPYFQAVYDSLLLREPDGTLSPMLATEWVYNEDATELTLTLRDDVTFTDGTAFDSSVVVANIEHFQAANGSQAGTAAEIASVEAPDATTVVITLNNPDPALLVSLSNALGFMASPDAVGTEEIAAAPVGSGPYLLDAANTVVGSQYSYVANPDYWGEALPYSTFVIMVLPDETARLNALKSGQINAAVFTGASAFAEIESAGLQLLSQTGDWLGFQMYDRTGQLNPAFADKRVREALTVAVDREGILEGVLQGRGELTNQIFGPSSLGYMEELDDDRYAYDPERAKELLADAGFASGLVVEMPISPAFDPAIYTTIEQNWADVGVTMQRKEYGPGETVPALVSGTHAIAYMALFLSTDWTTINQAVAPTATWNPLGYEDPVVTDLITGFQMATSDDERQGYAQELNEYIVDEMWFGVFYRNLQTYGADQDTVVELQVEQAVPSIYNYSPAS